MVSAKHKIVFAAISFCVHVFYFNYPIVEPAEQEARIDQLLQAMEQRTQEQQVQQLFNNQLQRTLEQTAAELIQLKQVRLPFKKSFACT